MKKFLYMAVVAIAALSSCSSDNDIIESGNSNNNNGEAKVFTGIIEGDATTRSTIAEGSTTGKKKVNWESTDEISINGVTYKTTPDGEDATKATFAKKTAGDEDPSATYKACYPATMASGTGSSVTFSLPATYTYDGNFNMPMYAESETISLEFKNICGVLAITVPSTQMSSVKSITVSSDKQMNGAFTATAAGVLTFAEKTLEAADKKVALTFSTAKTISSSETFYVPVPANTHGYLQIDVTDGTTTKTMKTKAASITVARNKFYPINFVENYDPNLLPGVFSVSATKKVQFTKGNLQATYNGSSYTWGFAANQWDYIGGKNSREGTQTGNNTIDSQTNGAVIDLFGWSTDATNNNRGIHTKKETTTGYTDGSFRDWSDNFPGKGYSTLSKDEWQYLLNKEKYNDQRTQTNKFAKAMVNGKIGLLIFPDNYNGTTYVNGTGIATKINTDEVAYPTESIPSDTWTTMESDGVVFLPAAGSRSGSDVYNAGKSGVYWSSMNYNSYNNMAFSLSFTAGSNKGSLSTAEGNYRYSGYSVRLVKVSE